MGCGRYCFLFIGIIAIFMGVREYRLNSYHSSVPDFEPIFANGTWNDVSSDIPQCYRPILYRKAFKYPQGGSCIDKDNCISLFKSLFIKLFGDQTVEILPLNRTRGKFKYGQRKISAKDFVLEDEFNDYVVQGLNGLDQGSKFDELLSFENQVKTNNYSDFKFSETSGHRFSGAQMFIAQRNNSGSMMHLALLKNVFTQLSGRKRWLLVSPKYWKNIGCKYFTHRGIYTNCEFKELEGKVNSGNIDIDMYKDVLLNKYKVPKEYIIDVIVEPGDVLINCVGWAHTIQNVEPFTSAIAIRTFPSASNKRAPTLAKLHMVSEALYVALLTKIYHPEIYTIIDGSIDTFLRGRRVLEQEKTFNGTAVEGVMIYDVRKLYFGCILTFFFFLGICKF